MNLRTSVCLVVPAAAIAFFAGTARATLNATAQVALTSTAGTNNTYTITVNNIGTDNIGTFWFAWTPPGAPIEYSFLPAIPSASTEPAGWVGVNVLTTPGYSIEYYNVSGNAILPSQSGSFTFTTTDTPQTLQSTYVGFPLMTSFIYAGFPLTGATARVNPTFVTTPEPASLGLLSIAGLALLRRRRD